jgi:predicted anti-sigma-YlaC factor YlaD
MSRLLLIGLLLAALNGCAVRGYVVDRIGDAVAGGGAAFASDDDPELVRAAAPFSLKLTESLLEERPRHAGLLLAAARGFTQYAYAFVQQDADEAEDRDLARARHLQARARAFYRRARDYGLRGLEESPQDVALLYWTGAAWAALIGLSKDDPEAIADLPRAAALIGRALERDEAFDRGALHSFMIAFEMAQPGAGPAAEARARAHFARAVELSAGMDAAPYVALAEAVCVPLQRRAEFERLLGQALAINPAARPAGRLANLVALRRAQWLRERAERLFLD